MKNLIAILAFLVITTALCGSETKVSPKVKSYLDRMATACSNKDVEAQVELFAPVFSVEMVSADGAIISKGQMSEKGYRAFVKDFQKTIRDYKYSHEILSVDERNDSILVTLRVTQSYRDMKSEKLEEYAATENITLKEIDGEYRATKMIIRYMPEEQKPEQDRNGETE